MDNTIVAAVLKTLSGYKTQGQLWDVIAELTERRHSAAEVEEILQNRAVMSREDPSYAPYVFEGDHNLKRFFGGLRRTVTENGTRKSQTVAWWPETIPYFEEALTAMFLWYVQHRYKDAAGAWQEIVSVCQQHGVAEQTLVDIHACGGPEDWIREMMRLAKREQALHTLAQKGRERQMPQEAVRRSAPAAEPVAPAKKQCSEPLPAAPATVRSLRRLEGQVLDALLADFPAWSLPDNWPLVESVSAALEFADGSYQDVAYIEFSGDSAPGAAEFVEGENLFFNVVDIQPDIASELSVLSYEETVLAEREKAARFGYYNHPPKLWMHHFTHHQDAAYPGKSCAEVTLGRIDYLDHRAWQLELAVNPTLQDKFLDALSGLRGRADEQLVAQPWARLGGGVWVIAHGDDARPYLLVSLRNPKKVAEVPGRLGYSASGAIDCADGTPAQAMVRELHEEIGLPSVSVSALRLISAGVDTERALVQLSYVLKTEHTLEDIRRFRKTSASTAGEQTLFFLPLDAAICERFLKHVAFEPGAAYSLMRLLQKRFS